MSLIRNSNQRTLLDIWPSLDAFKADLEGTYSPLKPDVTDATISTTVYMLMGRYGDSPILGYEDEGRWKLRFFTVYLSETPDWEVKTDIQKQVREMSADEIAKGDLNIYNAALNPNTEPGDSELTELNYINSQNTTRRTLNKLDALLNKAGSLDSSVNDRYLDKFSKLFSKFAYTSPIYTYDDNEAESDE